MQNSLQVAGINKLSTVDWPGHLVSTLFLQGCPWKCLYCHNYDIISPTIPGVLPWETVLSFLDKRVKLLDGVVFSGGEPLMQDAVFNALKDVRVKGLKIGVHTGGSYPKRLRNIIDHGLVDWVGLDIKSSKLNYPTLVGRQNSAEKAFESLDIILESGIDFEARTTISPSYTNEEEIYQLAEFLQAAGVQNYAVQFARSTGTSSTFSRKFTEFTNEEKEKILGNLTKIGLNNLMIR